MSVIIMTLLVIITRLAFTGDMEGCGLVNLWDFETLFAQLQAFAPRKLWQKLHVNPSIILCFITTNIVFKHYMNYIKYILEAIFARENRCLPSVLHENSMLLSRLHQNLYGKRHLLQQSISMSNAKNKNIIVQN